MIEIPEGFTPDPDASCGPADWPVDLVPDVILGLDVSEACVVHDWEYENGGDETSRLSADERFYWHLLDLVEEDGGPWAPLRRAGARFYFWAVRLLGGPSFEYREAYRVRRERRELVSRARAAVASSPSPADK